ncbi:MFS transporter [Caulobacter segnis]|uniref:MFS transporter n=1 Tax=Caulobacter segnis TaxID=88688 RepID=A0A2W5V0P6_9CAUL|nr:MFS transporter [Caulobacter segnis]PZR33440.1 MAG: MFS transporter [Caulobacter segnis]
MTPSKTTHPGLVLAALALGGFAIGTTEFASMSLLPYFAKDLGVDAPTAGHAISAYALGVVVGAPIIAVAAARLPRRVILTVLMAVFALGNLLSALAPTFGWMLAFRFFSGLPHGAYFGVAALVAASVSPPDKRARSVAMVMIGLTIATILGVPMANIVGQWIGWRWGFVIVAILAALTALSVWLQAPRVPADAHASPMRELSALAKGRVWLTLAIGAIGFGGLFCVYTYLADTLLAVTHAPPAALPVVLAVFGAGMTVGTLACAWAADRALMPAIGGILLWSAGALALYPLAVGDLRTLLPVVFLIGCGGGLGSALQTRLMDVAGDAQTLAAALNHSAFNTANALGPWLGGLAIAAGYGWASTGWVGVALALGGFAIWVAAALDARRQSRRLALVPAE